MMSNWFNKNLEDAVVILRMPHEVSGGMNIYSGKDLAELVSHLIKADNELGELLVEANRLRDALQHIADDYLSPCITFARFVLEGDSVEVAHKKQCDIRDRSD